MATEWLTGRQKWTKQMHQTDWHISGTNSAGYMRFHHVAKGMLFKTWGIFHRVFPPNMIGLCLSVIYWELGEKKTKLDSVVSCSFRREDQKFSLAKILRLVEIIEKLLKGNYGLLKTKPGTGLVWTRTF